MRELRGEWVYIVSESTTMPLKMYPDGHIAADGGLGPACMWKVQKLDYPSAGRPAVGFINKKQRKHIAIKQGHIQPGGGGEHCELVVQRSGKAVQLIKHNNQRAKLGFNANGSPADPKTLGNGARARFFIFDVDDVNSHMGGHAGAGRGGGMGMRGRGRGGMGMRGRGSGGMGMRGRGGGMGMRGRGGGMGMRGRGPPMVNM